MNSLTNKSPGTYSHELNSFRHTVVPVPTAVPAFIGYTPQAVYEGKSHSNAPVKITSFVEFEAVFGYDSPPSPASPIKQYDPKYYFTQQAKARKKKKQIY